MALSLRSHMHRHAALLPVCYFLFILPHVQSQPEPTPLTSPCPVVLPTNSRIVGGLFIDSPYMVYFRTSIGACSGTLITQTDILTARHCDIDTSVSAFVSSTNGSDGTLIPIGSVAKHPRDDIMLVTLARKADVEPVKLLANPDLPSGWSFVRGQGYGVQSGLPFPSDSRQRFVDFPVIPTDICESISGDATIEGVPLSQNPAFPDDYLCTGYLQSASCTFCSGDSGGAVFSLLNGDPVLVGVISSGNVLCSIPGNAGFSVRVSSYIDWLDEQGVEYDAVTELSETFVNSGGVSGGDGTSRLPNDPVGTKQAGLAPGAIAGIAVGGVAAVLIVVLAALFFVKRSKGGGADPPADGGENDNAPVATGSFLLPPTQPGQVHGPNILPAPAPMYGTAQGKFVDLAQPSQQPPQAIQALAQPQPPTQTAPQPNQLPAQQTTPVVYPTPTAQAPMQTAPQLSPPPTQQTTSAVCPMPTAPPPPPPPQTAPQLSPPPTQQTTSAVYPVPTAQPPPPQTSSAVDPTSTTQPPTQPPHPGPFW